MLTTHTHTHKYRSFLSCLYLKITYKRTKIASSSTHNDSFFLSRFSVKHTALMWNTKVKIWTEGSVFFPFAHTKRETALNERRKQRCDKDLALQINAVFICGGALLTYKLRLVIQALARTNKVYGSSRMNEKWQRDGVKKFQDFKSLP